MLVMLAGAMPVWAAKKATIQDLRLLVKSLQETRKGDAEVATRLKEVDLGEQLTTPTRKELEQLVPGPDSVEQLVILQGRTAMLPPPAAELPTAPAPDTATQKAILSKAVEFVTNVYMKNPRVSAVRATTRYQDGVTQIATNSGMTNNMPSDRRNWEPINKYLLPLGTTRSTTEMEKGAELPRPVKQDAPWGRNGQISEGGPGPILSVILQEAAASGTIRWERWEVVRGHQAAVFAFNVPKKKAHYEVHYCCFPVTQDTGRMGYEGTGANLQFNVTWKDFRSMVGYHGELYVDPNSGTILRVITEAELKPTDFVHQEDMRIDYGPVAVHGETYVLPIEAFTLNEVVPNGDNYAARYSVRHTLFHMTYSEYQLAQN